MRDTSRFESLRSPRGESNTDRRASETRAWFRQDEGVPPGGFEPPNLSARNRLHSPLCCGGEWRPSGDLNPDLEIENLASSAVRRQGLVGTPGRTQTCISWIRRPAPYSLDHGGESREGIKPSYVGLQPARLVRGSARGADSRIRTDDSRLGRPAPYRWTMPACIHSVE